jgi:hypothetical protein
MPKPLTFLDSNVLIGAWTGKQRYSVTALSLVNDPNREFVSSPFVRLETYNQAAYHRHKTELQSRAELRGDSKDLWQQQGRHHFFLARPPSHFSSINFS